MYQPPQPPSYGRSRHSHHDKHTISPRSSSRKRMFRKKKKNDNNNNPISPSSSSSSPASPSSSNERWPCPMCTFDNKPTATKCSLCLTPKPSQSELDANKIHKISYSSNMSNSNTHSNSSKTSVSHSNNHNNNYNNFQKPSPINKMNKNKINKINKNNKNNAVSFPKIALSPPNSPHKHHKTPVQPIIDDPSQTVPSNITFNPKKPIIEQSIFERWMIAQIERSSGQQPAICIMNNVMLTNLRRVRAPTTFRTLQNKIDLNTQVKKHADNLDAGDFTDDEEDDLSGMYPSNSPRSMSNSGGYAFTPTASDNEMDDNSNKATHNKHQSTSNQHLFGGRNRRNNLINGNNSPNDNSPNSNSPYNPQQYHHTAFYSQPIPDNNEQLSPIPLTTNPNNNKFPYSQTPQPQPQPQPHPNGKNGFKNGYNTHPMQSHPHPPKRTMSESKKLHRRRHKSKKRNLTVSQLWFKAQSQLKQGRNPPILAKYNIKLQNIRQHNPRFRDYQRRKSHHEKAANYLQVTGDKLTKTKRRNNIANDGDDDNDFTDTDDDDYSDYDDDIDDNNVNNVNNNNNNDLAISNDNNVINININTHNYNNNKNKNKNQYMD